MWILFKIVQSLVDPDIFHCEDYFLENGIIYCYSLSHSPGIKSFAHGCNFLLFHYAWIGPYGQAIFQH